MKKIIGIITLVAGIAMMVAGAVTWGVVTSQLKDERIVVSPDAQPVMGMKVAGKKVQGPITAYGEAEIIKEHANKAGKGKTYAEIGKEQNRVKEAAKVKGVDDLTSTDPAVQAKIEADPELKALKGELTEWTQARTTQMNGAFLRTSLFASVIVYGVAALVMGLGLLHTLSGLVMLKRSSAPVRAADE